MYPGKYAQQFADRPAFSHPEQPAKPASCESIAAQLPDSIPADSRVDMAIAGPVSLVRTDGALSGYRWGVARKRALLDREADA